MPRKVNIRKEDPERFAVIKAEQDELRRIYSSPMEMVRKCPYCGVLLSVVPRGNHTYTRQRCPNCGTCYISASVVQNCIKSQTY